MKLFLIMTITIISIVLILIFINSFIIESYYLYNKKESLLDAYSKINILFNQGLNNNKMEIEKIGLSNNFNIVIKNKYNNNIFNSNSDFIYNLHIENISDDNLLYKDEDKYIINAQDNKNEMNFLLLVGKLDTDNTVYIRMPIASIKDSIKITNDLLYSIGIITVIISGVAILIISKKFTKPIEELSDIANKMSNLDFSKKYNTNYSHDEVDKLGTSINKMSDKLENTITQLKKYNSKLEKDIEEKSKIDEMRKQFISDVSHELKTPIALIQGYSEGLIENVNTDEENKKFYAEVIQDEANKMDIMVKKLLELMKIEYGTNNLNNKYFDLTELINKILIKYTVLIDENNIDVKFNLIEPVYVYADAYYIEQIMNNYLSNAIKNAEEVDGEKYIKINISLINRKIRTCVYNTGKNIDEENINKIWNRFYKEDTSRNREKGGSGIGLSIVKAIMNNVGNEYGVINKPKGVEFFFDLNIEK